jgi:hypothetical protein
MAIPVISSCKSKQGVVNDSSCSTCEDAVIRDFGDPALDGCGWVVDVSSIIYKPQNLLPKYRIDSLEVRIKYEVLDSVNCGLVKNAHSTIFIEEIHREK